jgi:putative ABC transport system permease protein
MKLLQNLIEALESLNANKLRSMLTVLGIVIGVAAVIAMLSIGRGATSAITSQIESIGTNLIYVSPGAIRQGGVTSAQGSAGTLTLDDANAVLSLPNIVAVAPETNGFAQIVYLGQNTNSRLVGTTPSYQTLRNLVMADGSFISDSNLATRSSVIVLGANVATDLFGSTAGMIGQSVRVNGQPYRVVGVMEAKGGTGFSSQDDQVIVPLTTAQTRLTGASSFRGANRINQINIQVDNAKNVNQAMTAVTELMRERHGTTADTDDFSVSSQQEALAAVTSVTNTLSIFLGGIAGISLLVGGIGIMNIMLTTVTERTHEIGLRKAVGARRRDIMTQFLVESVLLSSLGGIIGVAVGWAIARLIGQVQLSGSTITPVVSIDSVLLATIFSMAVGLFFGIYPASRASRLQPVEALRYE